jgi:hypothetical protein
VSLHFKSYSSITYNTIVLVLVNCEVESLQELCDEFFDRQVSRNKVCEAFGMCVGKHLKLK